jgi:hypothetical protein
MPASHTDTPDRDAESEIWNAIGAFEKILEAIPDDRSSLETLSHAYEHIGDKAKLLMYLLRLGDVLVSEGDAAAAGDVHDKLAKFGSEDPEVLRVRASLARLLDSSPEVSTDSSPTQNEPATPAATFSMADELSFAWHLFEVNELTQQEYADVAQSLSEMSASEHLVTVSVLHALEHQTFGGMDRLMGYVARDTKSPIVSLQAFDIQEEASSLLPLEFCIRHGAVVFDLIAGDALVVVMNPHDQVLRKLVEDQLGRPCHFFISPPAEFDAVLEGIRTARASQ